MKNINSKNKGFSLVEILVALSIFALIATATTTALLAVIDANARTRTLRSAIDNMTIAMESMSRTIRLGTGYSSGSGSTFSFNDQNGVPITYSLNGTSIEKTVNNGSPIPITAPEIEIQNLIFQTTGEAVGDGNQPRVLILIRGKASTNAGNISTEFTLQNTVSQREYQCDSLSSC